MTAIERIKSYTMCCNYRTCQDCPICYTEDKAMSCKDYIASLAKNVIEDFETNAKLQEQYVTKLESDNEKLRKIVNILCDTISQLIE